MSAPADQRVFELELAGQQWRIPITSEELAGVHIPLIRRIIAGAERRPGRHIVFIAGPPGTGKSTLAELWRVLAGELRPELPVQCLPMDGFHLPNAILDVRRTVRDGQRVPLRRIKGAPESFDLEALAAALSQLASGDDLRWPVYDRQIHDPIPNAIDCVPSGLFFVEGNYLLLDEPGWRELSRHARRTLFIEAPEGMVRDDLIARACKGGRTREDAERHYAFNDTPNRLRVMSKRLPPDTVLQVTQRPGLGRGLTEA